MNHRRRTSSGFLVGVDVGPSVLRASLFARGPELVGKMKLSTKPQRGAAAVIERIERCVRYAVDESDSSIESVSAIGVAVPGGVISPEGDVTLERDFGWHAVPLKKRLEARLGRPVFVGNGFGLAALAVATLETIATARDTGVGVLFPGAILGAGVVADGKMQDLSEYPEDKPLLPPGAGNVVHRTAEGRFQSFRARDFRKAIRGGDSAAGRFLLRSVRAAAKFGVRMARRGVVRRLVLAGGALDENRAAALAEARRVLRVELGPAAKRRLRIPITASELGDQAVLMGAAILAQQGVQANNSHRHRNRSRKSRRAEGLPGTPLDRSPGPRSSTDRSSTTIRRRIRPATQRRRAARRPRGGTG